jgi:hypothetical protein
MNFMECNHRPWPVVQYLRQVLAHYLPDLGFCGKLRYGRSIGLDTTSDETGGSLVGV